MIIILLALFVLVAILIGISICIVPDSYAYVVESARAYKCCWYTGVHMKIVGLHRVVAKIQLNEQTLRFRIGDNFSNNNHQLQYSIELSYNVIDPKLYVYGVPEPVHALVDIATKVITQILQENPESTNTHISQTATTTLNEAILHWGMKISRLEINN